MKVYRGVRERFVVRVMVNDEPLDPRLDLANHSPSGFEWGYPGSGPAQLALALLGDHLGDDAEALARHQAFKLKVVTVLPPDGWVLTTTDVHEALAAIQDGGHP
jgi:hypothetical protein